MTSSSTMDGGGVRGKAAGIARVTTTQVGPTFQGSRLFMPEYTLAGGMTTGTIAGKGSSGTTNEYLNNGFNRTGWAGKRINIGRNNKLGVSRVSNPGGNHNNRPEKASHVLN
ncbi:MAG: hypothetical protein HQL08_01655 [Nitrospirae bacterium]|nr:hypothetical protein [Nitrospirota bacterium]